MKKIIVIIALLCVVAALVFLFLNRETIRIRRQFKKVAELISKDGPETNIQELMKAQAVKGFIAEQVSFSAGPGLPAETFEADEMAGLVYEVRAAIKQGVLKFSDLEVSFPSGEIADVNVKAIFIGATTQGEAISEALQLNCVLLKQNGKWVFSQVESEEK